MSDVHPLEREFLEAIEFLEGAIAAAREAQGVAANPMGEFTLYHTPHEPLGFIWMFGGPGTPITTLQWPWDDPSGWTVARSGE